MTVKGEQVMAQQSLSRLSQSLIVVLLALIVFSTHAAHALTGTRNSSFEYDPNTGLLTKEIVEPGDPVHELVKTYTYDAFGNVTDVTVSGPGITARTTTTEYDAQGRFVTKVTNALGQFETWVTDPKFGAPTSQTGPNGLTTTWEYDLFGRKTKETGPDGNYAVVLRDYCAPYGSAGYCPAYSAFFEVASPKNASGTTNGAQVAVYFDSLSRPVGQDTPNFTDTYQVRTLTRYDAFGRVEKTSRAHHHVDTPAGWTTYTYDDLGRVLSMTTPDSAVTSTVYNGLETTVTNALGIQTRTTVNARGEIASVTEGLGTADETTTQYSYDPYGNLVALVDPAGNVTTHDYDQRGRKVASHDPDMGTWTYAYNTLDQLTSQTDAKGQTTTMAYDVLGRVASRIEGGETTTWTYDTATKGVGKLHSVSVGAGTAYGRTHTYDSLGRPAATTVTIDGTQYSSSATYDANGRPDTATSPSGFTRKYIYTSLGFLSEIRDNATSATLWTANARDADGQLTQATLGNGVQVNQAFDPLTGRIDTIQAGFQNDVADLSFTFDYLGNVTARNDVNMAINETFTYDALNRLKTYQVGTQTAKTVSYDLIGNITSKSDIGAYGYTATGAARPHAVSSVAGTVNGVLNPTYAYDANGNMTDGAGRSLTYTSFNKVASITQGATIISYAYDDGRSRTKQVTPTETTYYLGLTEKKVGTGGAVTWHDYIEADGKRVAMRIHEPATSTTNWNYFVHDHLGSIVATLNSAGQVIERMSFDAWGKRRVPETAEFYAAGFTPTFTTPRGFTGHEHIDEVGLINMNARVYDPELGRFLQADSIVQEPYLGQNLNRYSYVLNNPLSYTDPTGHFFKKLFKAIGKFFSRLWKSISRILKDAFIHAVLELVAIQLGVPPGVASSAVASAAQAGLNGGSLKDMAIAAVFSIGRTRTAGLNPGAKVATRALLGGLRAEVQGGDFKQGFVVAGVYEVAGVATEGEGPNTQLVAFMIAGGIAEEVGGGKFSNGATSAAFDYLAFSIVFGTGTEGVWIDGKESDRSKVETNGISGSLERALKFILNNPTWSFYFNPSQGPIFDITESIHQRFFFFLGDPLAAGLARGLKDVQGPLTVVGHSQGTLTVVNAVRVYGLNASGSTFVLKSAALSRIEASVISRRGGNMEWVMPVGDIANLYAPSFFPPKMVSGFIDILCGACIHRANGN